MSNQTAVMSSRQVGSRHQQKQAYLEKILDLEAAAAEFTAKANEYRKAVVEEFCPWEVGQFIRIDRGIQEETAKIVIIKYRPGEECTINGEWVIKVQPYLKDLSRPAKNRGSYALLPDTDFKIIPQNQTDNNL